MAATVMPTFPSAAWTSLATSCSVPETTNGPVSAPPILISVHGSSVVGGPEGLVFV